MEMGIDYRKVEHLGLQKIFKNRPPLPWYQQSIQPAEMLQGWAKKHWGQELWLGCIIGHAEILLIIADKVQDLAGLVRHSDGLNY